MPAQLINNEEKFTSLLLYVSKNSVMKKLTNLVSWFHCTVTNESRQFQEKVLNKVGDMNIPVQIYYIFLGQKGLN